MTKGIGQGPQRKYTSSFKDIRRNLNTKPQLSLSESFKFLQLYAKRSISLFRTRRNENDLQTAPLKWERKTGDLVSRH